MGFDGNRDHFRTFPITWVEGNRFADRP
jgi:hypothetical protein